MLNLSSPVLMLAMSILLIGGAVTKGGERMFYAGVDLSGLPSYEAAGAVYRDSHGDGDAIRIFADHGCNLFRIRLFVNPSDDPIKSAGAVQDLSYALALARRAKATGAKVLLDFHYSDTWADPGQQIKPAAWENLQGAELEQTVFQYTRDTLSAFKEAGVLPELVQIGNENEVGMIFPDGRVHYGKDAVDMSGFAQLVNAGIRGVRAVQDADAPIEIVIHIHGGERPGAPRWFFEQFDKLVSDYDIMGLSFYPDAEIAPAQMDQLKANLQQLLSLNHRGVMMIETSYPWMATPKKSQSEPPWPTTPAGQKAYLLALATMLKSLDNGRGRGFIWWNAEARPNVPLATWQWGSLSLFDADGQVLPAIEVYRDAAAPQTPGH